MGLRSAPCCLPLCCLKAEGRSSNLKARRAGPRSYLAHPILQGGVYLSKALECGL
jgi:hypothetical protein